MISISKLFPVVLVLSMTIYDHLSALYGATIQPAKPIFSSATQHPPAAPSISSDKQQPAAEKEAFLDALERNIESKVTKCSFSTSNLCLKQWRNRSSAEKLRARFVSDLYIFKLLNSKCIEEYDRGQRPVCHANCSHNCQHKFKYDADVLKQEMQVWWGEATNNTNRVARLYDDLKDWSIKKEDGSYEIRWFIDNREVCRNFYLRARGMQHETVRKLTNQFLKEKRTYLSAVCDKQIPKDDKQAPLRDEIVAWMSIFCKHVGDKLPDQQITVLPYRSLAAVYEEYVDDLNSVGSLAFGKPAKSSHFYDIFAKESANMKVRLSRDSGNFVNCKICDAYATHLRTARTWEHRLKIKEYRRKHLAKQRQQRDKYYKHRRKAMSPEGRKRYLSMIIDGMDQKKTYVPVMGSRIKDESPLVQRLIGVKVHGHRSYVFIVDDNTPGGANLIADIVRRVLNDLNTRGELPYQNPTLYLQVDNCSENKNKVVFGFLTHLVRLGIFQKIKVGFLMVGHTHEDIDQMFSTISGHLQKESVLCPDLESFVKAVGAAFTEEVHKPETICLSALDILDYSTFYFGYLDKNLHHYQEPHQFRIKAYVDMHGTTVVLVNYKSWCCSAYWLPKDTNTSTTPSNLSTSPPGSSEMKKRKKTTGQLTLGQKMAMERAKQFKPNIVTTMPSDIAENLAYATDAEGGVFEDDDVSTERSSNFVGIKWLTETPDLKKCQHITFSEVQVQSALKKCEKVISSLQSNFFPSYRSLFSDQVIKNWNSWFNCQADMWRFENFDISSIGYTEMLLPPPYATRLAAVPVPNSPEQILSDPAPNDIDDDQQYVTHESGVHGSFSIKDREGLVRELLDKDLNEEVSGINDALEGTFCIYVYEYESQKNIMLGKIKAIRYLTVDNKPADVKEIDVLQCPLKGAKKDNLYQDISADSSFNLNYYIRVTDTLEPSMVLCYNLYMNDNGTLSKRRKQGKYSQTPYMTAKQVIEKFYAQKC